MKLAQLRLRNFRCYRDEIVIDFSDMTALIGRNDAGKSTIMEALDIFFNDGVPDKNDVSKGSNSADIAIVAVFTELPGRLVLDQTEPTSLESEYLLNSDGKLEVHKIFNGALEKPKLSALKLVALHPTSLGTSDLISLSNSDLKRRAKDIGVNLERVDQRVNAQIRKAIRLHVGELAHEIREISLMDGNGASVWKGIQAQLPVFALFKSDRTSTDQDPEAQDPLNMAIKEAVRQKEAELNEIAKHIEEEVKKIAELTLRKLQEMDGTLASTLKPHFPAPKWANLFKASITGDEGIPINKRGSGVRRLILLNFFRAKAEQMMIDNCRQNAIYAVEEPETSQHPRNQRLLVSALQELAGRDQVFVTTHTPMLARAMPANCLRFIHTHADGTREVLNGGHDGTNELISRSLGVLPDHNVKIFIGVEGKHDIPFLKNLSNVLNAAGYAVPNLTQLELNGELIFTPLGGSALALWCNRLAGLNRPEFHLYDRDNPAPQAPKYQQYVDEVNARPNCKATSTNRREAENYIHIDAINAALGDLGIPVTFTEPIGGSEDLPTLLVQRVNQVVPDSNKWGQNRAKDFLCNAAITKMTREMLEQTDHLDEILGWFSDIDTLMQQAV